MKATSLILLSLALLAHTAPTHASQPACRRVATCLPLLKAGKTCPLFRMLPGTYANPPGPAGYVLTCFRKNVYHYSDDAYHALILYSKTTKTLAVIDFPRSANSFAPDGSYRLTTAVAEVLREEKPLFVYMVYGHRHLDHMGGAGIFHGWVRERFPSATSRVWGTRETLRALRRRGPEDIPPPTEFVKETTEVVVGPDLTIRLSVVGGHTRSDLLAYLPPTRVGKRDGIVHVADLVASGEAPFIQFALAMDVTDFLRAHHAILKLDFEYLSTGHGKIGNKNDVRVSRAYTMFVLATIKRVAAAIPPQEVGAIVSRIVDEEDRAFRNGAWALKRVLDLQVAACRIEVIRKWACRLSAVDVFAEGHCLVAALHNLVEV